MSRVDLCVGIWQEISFDYPICIATGHKKEIMDMTHLCKRGLCICKHIMCISHVALFCHMNIVVVCKGCFSTSDFALGATKV